MTEIRELPDLKDYTDHELDQEISVGGSVYSPTKLGLHSTEASWMASLWEEKARRLEEPVEEPEPEIEHEYCVTVLERYMRTYTVKATTASAALAKVSELSNYDEGDNFEYHSTVDSDQWTVLNVTTDTFEQ